MNSCCYCDLSYRPAPMYPHLKCSCSELKGNDPIIGDHDQDCYQIRDSSTACKFFKEYPIANKMKTTRSKTMKVPAWVTVLNIVFYLVLVSISEYRMSNKNTAIKTCLKEIIYVRKNNINLMKENNQLKNAILNGGIIQVK